MYVFWGKYFMQIFVVFVLNTVLSVSSLQEASASPVRRTEIVLVQPDGYRFSARLSGDEFLKVLQTPDGKPLIQEEDGSYYYGVYESSGTLVSTGCKVGEQGQSLLSLPGTIPYETLAYMAFRSRSTEYQAGISNKTFNEHISGTAFLDAYSDEIHVPVLLVEFNDLKFKYTKADFELFLNQKGYSVNGAEGSVKDYFDEQFSGQCTFVFDLADIVTLDKPVGYYGRNQNVSEAGSDIRVGRMAFDACRLADEKVDFSRYDYDRDGVLDYLLIIYAGGDEAAGAGSDHIWSKFGFVDQGHSESWRPDGIRISGFACTSERATDGRDDDPIAGIGTFCHEMGHALGLPDFYDYNLRSECLWGRTSLMDRGNTNNSGRTPPNLNSIERELLGLSKPVLLTEGSRRLSPLNKTGICYRYDTDTKGEYFLFECREQSGWDRYIGGSGLLVYHIDKSDNNVLGMKACDKWKMSGLGANTVNSVKEHQCADLVESDSDLVYSGLVPPESTVSRVFFPRGGENTSFTPMSDPKFISWSGTYADISLTDIEYSGENVYFKVVRNEYSRLPFVRELKVDEFQDAAILSWNVNTDLSADVIFSGDGIPEKVLTVAPYSKGCFSVTFEGLSPSTRYTVSIGYSMGNVTGRVRIRNIITHPETPMSPYIFLYGIRRNRDGSFPPGTALPLRLYNAYDAESVTWTKDGVTVSPDESGYYTPDKSGVLEAIARYSDGSEYRVSKYIEIGNPNE